MTAADHANTVRGVLRRSVWTTGMADNADAALDALQAQAETAERLRGYLDITRGERDEWAKRAEAAEAERDRLADALRPTVEFLEGSITFDADWEAEAKQLVAVARAALAGEDKP